MAVDQFIRNQHRRMVRSCLIQGRLQLGPGPDRGTEPVQVPAVSRPLPSRHDDAVLKLSHRRARNLHRQFRTHDPA